MKLYACDRCRANIEDTDSGRREWTSVGLTKVDGSSIFQKADLCKDCTSALRLLLQGAELAPHPDISELSVAETFKELKR